MARNVSNTFAIINLDELPPLSNTASYGWGVLEGAKQLAVLFAIHGIVLRWRVHLVINASGTFEQTVSPFSTGDWSYAIDAQFTVEAKLSSSGSTPGSEAKLSDPREALQVHTIFNSPVIGAYEQTVDGVTTTGNVTAASVRFSAFAQNYNTNFSYNIENVQGPWTFGDRYGATSAFFEAVSISGGGAPGSVFTANSGQNSSGLIVLGECNIEIPDWIEQFYPGQFLGETKLTTLFLSSRPGAQDHDTTFSGSGSVNITPHGSLGSVFPYGYDPSNPLSRTTTNRVWNDDGSAALNPLLIRAV